MGRSGEGVPKALSLPDMHRAGLVLQMKLLDSDDR